MMMAPIAGSFSAAFSFSISRARMGPCQAFRISGRFSVMMATRPSLRDRMKSSNEPAPCDQSYCNALHYIEIMPNLGDAVNHDALAENVIANRSGPKLMAAKATMKREDPLYVRSIEKAFRVLTAFGTGHASLSLSQIAAAAELDKSAAQRFTHTLE